MPPEFVLNGPVLRPYDIFFYNNSMQKLTELPPNLHSILVNAIPSQIYRGVYAAPGHFFAVVKVRFPDNVLHIIPGIPQRMTIFVGAYSSDTAAAYAYNTALAHINGLLATQMVDLKNTVTVDDTTRMQIYSTTFDVIKSAVHCFNIYTSTLLDLFAATQATALEPGPLTHVTATTTHEHPPAAAATQPASTTLPSHAPAPEDDLGWLLDLPPLPGYHSHLQRSPSPSLEQLTDTMQGNTDHGDQHTAHHFFHPA